MKKGILIFLGGLLWVAPAGLSALWGPAGYAAEKLKFATAIKFTPAYYLPILAAEEKGFWKEQGLDLEWVPFRGGPDMHAAMVAGAINLGMETAAGLIPGAARGVPTIIVSDLQNMEGVALYVLPTSPIRDPKELKGTRVAVTRMGAVDHAYTQFLARVLGLEKDIRVVAAGGIPEKLAALKAGAVDAFAIFIFPVAELRTKGEIKELLRVDDFKPKEWLAHVVFSHRGFLEKERTTVRKAVRAVLAGAGYATREASWAKVKMKEMQNYSDRTGEEIFRFLKFSPEGKISRAAVENVRKFLIDFGVIAREKAPAVEALYTAEFTG